MTVKTTLNWKPEGGSEEEGTSRNQKVSQPWGEEIAGGGTHFASNYLRILTVPVEWGGNGWGKESPKRQTELITAGRVIPPRGGISV